MQISRPRLKLDQPFDWQAMLQFFAARVIPGVDQVKGLTYQRTFSLAKATGILTVTSAKSGVIEAELKSTSRFDEVQAKQRLRYLLNASSQSSNARRQLSRDEVLSPLLKNKPGLRVPGVWDPFELGVRAILGQQVSVAGATTLAGRIALKFGRKTKLDGTSLTHLFPTPEALADADLSGLGLTTRRAATIVGFAQAICDAPTLLDRSKTLEQFVEDLVALKGFGPWTAHYMAMRLGYSDAFPASDLGIRKALNMAPEKEVLTRAEPWRPHRATAAIYLWSSLNSTPSQK